MKFSKTSKIKLEDEVSSDEHLLELYRNTGDSKYFGELYNRYIPLLYGMCLKYLQNEDEAEDAVMEMFETLLPKILEYDIQTFRTWLYTVAKNHCFKILKSKKREILVDFDSQVVESDAIITLITEEPDSSYEEALDYCMIKLPEQQRKAIELFFAENMSYVDIAESLDQEVKTVKSNLQNGKRNLKNCIENRIKNEVS